MTGTIQSYDVEQQVRKRYGSAAGQFEEALCCPSTAYESRYLKVLPPEILQRDYGCGDPARYARSGETVVDLGCGAGKVCYIISQKVGPQGQVIGVDFNDPMLNLARDHQPAIAARIGYDNVRFCKGRIQDLQLDLEAAQRLLEARPVSTVEDLAAFESACQDLRRTQAMISTGSVDLVVSNCVLNLVRPQDKQQLVSEIRHVLRPSGRAVICDIVADEDPTPQLVDDPKLWSGCISGAMREDAFCQMFLDAGFYGIQVLERTTEPWRTVAGIEFRSVTVQAYRGQHGPCLERNQAVIYRGPWQSVTDDDGHVLQRGRRMAVCDKTFGMLTDPQGPYHDQVEPVLPRNQIRLADAAPFTLPAGAIRPVRQTKGQAYDATTDADPASCCGPDGCC